MTTVTCGVCERKINTPFIKVSLLDGRHPHNGSTMRKLADVCINCASQIPNLESYTEIDNLRKEYKRPQKNGP